MGGLGSRMKRASDNGTNTKVVEQYVLMTTDPRDLVFDRRAARGRPPTALTDGPAVDQVRHHPRLLGRRPPTADHRKV